MSLRNGHSRDRGKGAADNPWTYLGFEEWEFARLLTRLSEPSIRCFCLGHPTAECYRIICLPAFDRPYTVRWQRSETQSIAVYQEADGRGGYDPGNLRRELKTELTADSWLRITALLDKHFFWSTPRRTPADGLDGESWLMEGVRGMRYRVISRWGGGTIEAILQGAREAVAEIRDITPDGRAG